MSPAARQTMCQWDLQSRVPLTEVTAVAQCRVPLRTSHFPGVGRRSAGMRQGRGWGWGWGCLHTGIMTAAASPSPM